MEQAPRSADRRGKPGGGQSAHAIRECQELAVSCRLAHFVAEIARFRTSAPESLNSDEFSYVCLQPKATSFHQHLVRLQA